MYVYVYTSMKRRNTKDEHKPGFHDRTLKLPIHATRLAAVQSNNATIEYDLDLHIGVFDTWVQHWVLQ